MFEIFSDRMEFTSYGRLIQGQNREDFFSCSSSQETGKLMRVFKDVGLVEQLGSGMSRILQIYEQNIFQISEHFIKVVFPFSWTDEMENKVNGNGDDNGDDIKVLLTLMENPSLTAKEISKKTGFSTRKISRIIKRLRESEKITRIGSDRKGYWEITNGKRNS